MAWRLLRDDEEVRLATETPVEPVLKSKARVRNWQNQFIGASMIILANVLTWENPILTVEAKKYQVFHNEEGRQILDPLLARRGGRDRGRIRDPALDHRIWDDNGQRLPCRRHLERVRIRGFLSQRKVGLHAVTAPRVDWRLARSHQGFAVRPCAEPGLT